MGVREFEPFYCAARAKYSRPQAMVNAIEAFLFDIYCALGVWYQRPINMAVYASQLYEEYRLKNYSHEEAWLLCERTIIDSVQQAFISFELGLGHSKSEAIDHYKLHVRNLRGRCPVLDQYREILTPDTRDSRPNNHSRYTGGRQTGASSYARGFWDHTTSNASTRPSGYGRPQGSSAKPPSSGYTRPHPTSRHGPSPTSDYTRLRPQYKYGPPPNSGYTPPRPQSRYPPPPTSGYTRPPPSPEYTPPSPAFETDSSVCLYSILGISRSATADDIKQAHRKLMLKWHPDRNPGNEAEATAQTKIINQARDVLSDPEKKALYDRTGYMA